MGFIRRERSGNYFGGSKLIVPGQGVLTFKKYNNEINKSKINKENYDDIPSPTLTPTPTPTMTITPTLTPTITPSITPTMTNTPTTTSTPTPTPTPTKACTCVSFVGGKCFNLNVTYLDCDGNLFNIIAPFLGSVSVCADLSFEPVYNSGCVTMSINSSCSEPPCI